jgi:hypothetical protein
MLAVLQLVTAQVDQEVNPPPPPLAHKLVAQVHPVLLLLRSFTNESTYFPERESN